MVGLVVSVVMALSSWLEDDAGRASFTPSRRG
jgi:hypothetical protein